MALPETLTMHDEAIAETENLPRCEHVKWNQLIQDQANLSRLFDATDLIPTSQQSWPKAEPLQVSFLITRAQHQRLRAMGYPQVAIDEMTPELAHSILNLRP
jgi:hypothetical protein